ncbi:MAG: class I SAM-dependent methyltransferase [Methanomicrobiales archaeon]|nr:class I SAM-dependent methyltransferase [Methanomicrobiales archaeon]
MHQEHDPETWSHARDEGTRCRCGTGRRTIPIADIVGPVGEVTAVDIQGGMLNEAHNRADMANLTNIRFILTGAGRKKLEHNGFDRAVMVTVLGEIPDREAASADIVCALKPGGGASCWSKRSSGTPISRQEKQSKGWPVPPGSSNVNFRGRVFPIP